LFLLSCQFTQQRYANVTTVGGNINEQQLPYSGRCHIALSGSPSETQIRQTEYLGQTLEYKPMGQRGPGRPKKISRDKLRPEGSK